MTTKLKFSNLYVSKNRASFICQICIVIAIHTVLLRIDYTDSTTVVQDTLDPSGRDNNLKKHQCQRVFRSFRSEIHLTKCNLVQVRKNKVHKNKAAFHF